MAGTESSMMFTEGSTIEKQASEVATVKSLFPNGCRVVTNCGNFSHVITVQPKNLDATIKLQLTSSYPFEGPEINVRSESLTKSDIGDLVDFLKSKSKASLGQEMLLTLIHAAETKFSELGLRPGKTSIVDSHTYLNKKPIKQKKKKHKRKSEDEVDVNEKLPSMKTADDVIKRIIWDENLNTDEFVVGYIDRFIGLVEKYFCAFSWEDLSTVDYDVLAVPRHRIQYFSYKGVKVWDKPRRIDNVFGSAAGTKTIDVVMKELQEAENSQNNEQRLSNNIEKSVEADEEDFESSESDDEDDGFMVTIGSGCNIGMTRDCASEIDVDCDKARNDPYWQDKLRPNHFLCVRITDAKIRDQIGNIQDHLMEVEPLFGECCIPGAALHLTLSVLGLDTPEQIHECSIALNKAKPDLSAALQKSSLELCGVSNFYNRVIYAKVKYANDFLDFRNLLTQVLSQAGVQIRDGYEFVPHVTIMKTTRPVSRLRGTKDIQPEIYKPFLDVEFGEQKIDAIYLCSMGNERRDDGFYFTPAEIRFDSDSV